MIKQDYLIRMIQEIVTALVDALLRHRKITRPEWSEYEGIAGQILKTDPVRLQAMSAEDILSFYQEDTDKIELAAMLMLKMAEDCEGNLLLKPRLRQNGLALLQHVQAHGQTYSLQRELLIRFLKSNP